VADGARMTMNNVRKLSRQNQTTKLQGSDMKPVAKLGNDVKAKIGQQLRLMYDEIVEQGVPERFAEILEFFLSASCEIVLIYSPTQSSRPLSSVPYRALMHRDGAGSL